MKIVIRFLHCSIPKIIRQQKLIKNAKYNKKDKFNKKAIDNNINVKYTENMKLNKKVKKEDVYLRNDLFVTAGEVAQDLGVSKPFAYKLVRQMNEELEAKGFITIAGRVSRKYYEEKFYGMVQAN